MNSSDKADDITEAINFEKDDYARVENPFHKKRAEEKIILPLKPYMAI